MECIGIISLHSDPDLLHDLVQLGLLPHEHLGGKVEVALGQQLEGVHVLLLVEHRASLHDAVDQILKIVSNIYLRSLLVKASGSPSIAINHKSL